MGSTRAQEEDEEVGLVVNQAGEEHLAKYLTLVLSYLYGFNLVVVSSLGEASALLMERSAAVRCVFIVGDKLLRSQTPLTAIGLRGKLPVFLLYPDDMLDGMRQLAQGMRNIFFFSWQHVAAPGERSLRELIDDAFERNDIGGLFDGARHLSFCALQQRVQRRLKNLKTLPTLPEMVLRIMDVINDPDSSTDELERILLADTAVVHKLVQAVNTSSFAGSGQHDGRWGLREAIVRLGRKKLGSLALQIKLINSLIRPETSAFELRRFWIHSVGCALIADQIWNERLVDLDDWAEAADYWIPALLHDVGKLVLGFFFWSYFERVQSLVEESEITFRAAEARLGDIVTHERVGQLLLLLSRMERKQVEVVGKHHQTDTLPPPLVSIVHLANNLSKDLGMGYHPSERGDYSPAVLRACGLEDPGALGALRQRLRAPTVSEVAELIGHSPG